MCPQAEFTEGTLMTLDSESIALLPGWSEPAEGSDVTRIGSLVALSMQVKNIAEPAWVEATEYAAKAIVTRTGKLYESLSAANKEHDPATDAGVHWKLLTETPTHVAVLPVQYRPLVETTTPDGNFKVSTEGVITSTFALTAEPGSYKALQLNYRAAQATP